MEVGILGGTGPEGRGLGLRLAAGGCAVVIGSRDAVRARAIVEDLRGAWPERRLRLEGRDNAGAAEAELVIAATPWDGVLATVAPLADALAGKVVVSVGVALLRHGREVLPLQLPRGSVAASVQAQLPRSQVVGAFHHLPAMRLQDLGMDLDADVLVCADDGEAAATVTGLVERVKGLRPVHVGTLAQAGAIEAFTAVCITVNLRHRVQSSIRLTGL